MNDESNADDQQASQDGAGAGRHERSATGAERDHDEHHFQSFEQHGLETRKSCEPIEPRLVAAGLFTQFRCLVGKRQRLIVERDHARRTQDRLSQPAHAEQEEQDSDDELKEMERNAVKDRSERHHNDRQYGKACERARAGRAPAANGGDSQHDGQRFHRLDQRSKERGRHGRPNQGQSVRHAKPRARGRAGCIWSRSLSEPQQ